MINTEIKIWLHGLINRISAEKIPADAASDSQNFLTEGDRISLRRGMALVGTENVGASKITGEHIAYKRDGTQLHLRSRAAKVEYYDETTDDWVEVGSNILGTAASGEDVSFANYDSPAGAQCWFSSPNSGLFKMMVANPGSAEDNFDGTKNYKGKLRIKLNRMSMWGTKVSGYTSANTTSLFDSYIDARTYTTVTAQAVADVATGTLTDVTGIRTCFGVSITHTASGEIFTDNYNGVLTGSLGGTGTINYTTGAFTTSASGAGTSTYQWENSTANGIADFTYAATRLAGQGNIYPQSTGGALQTVLSIDDTDYCIHELETWALTRGRDDTTATNLIFRDHVGIQNHRGAISSGRGIYYIDNIDQNDPKVRNLTFEAGSTVLIPFSISDSLDLKNYRFNLAAFHEWGDYVLLACRHKDFTYNQTMFAYNKRLSQGGNHVWDKLDYYATCFATYNGTLMLGDSLAANTYQAFSNTDDDDSNISAYWIGKLEDHGISGLKKTKILEIEGYIGPNQSVNVYLANDRGAFSGTVGTIDGDGSYVDLGQQVHVGANVLGEVEIGGGSSSDLPAYHYIKQIKVNSDKFEVHQLKLEPTALGYFAFTKITFRDLRKKSKRLVSRYRS